MIAVLCLLMVSAIGCKSIFGPSDDPPVDKFINVDALYARVNDGSTTCPMGDPGREVRLSGLTGNNKLMTKVADGLYQLRVDNVKVNYPPDQYNLDPYEIYTLDSAFYTGVNQSCYCKARGLSFNGYRVPDDKVRKSEGKEYALVRFDENAIPHYY